MFDRKRRIDQAQALTGRPRALPRQQTRPHTLDAAGQYGLGNKEKWRLVYVDGARTTALFGMLIADPDTRHALKEEPAARSIQDAIASAHLPADLNPALVAQCLMLMTEDSRALPRLDPGHVRLAQPVRLTGRVTRLHRAESEIHLRIVEESADAVCVARLPAVAGHGWTASDVVNKRALCCGVVIRTRYRHLSVCALMLLDDLGNR